MCQQLTVWGNAVDCDAVLVCIGHTQAHALDAPGSLEQQRLLLGLRQLLCAIKQCGPAMQFRRATFQTA